MEELIEIIKLGEKLGFDKKNLDMADGVRIMSAVKKAFSNNWPTYNSANKK